ncbi:MAG: beta/gamma crystallin-related protein [Pseudomonadota bacterium]
MPLSRRLIRPLAALAMSAAALFATPLSLPASADGVRGTHHFGGHDRAFSSRGGRFDGGRAIVIYRDPGFSGRSAVIEGQADLGGSRFNDRVSSVEVLGGRWLLCSDPGFRGRCEVVEFDEPRLSRIGLNDNITSIRPVGRGFRAGNTGRFRSPRGSETLFGGRGHDPYDFGRGGDFGNAPVVLFADPDGRGRALPIFGAEPRFRPLRFDDIVSSIDVRSGVWEVCSDPYFQGRCEIVSGFEPRTRVFGLNDNISSIRPVERRRPKRRRNW